jgi:beta-galactosidase
MKTIAAFIFYLGLCLNCFSQTILFDDGWKFFRGGSQGAENINFKDSAWRTVDLPHDWSIEDLPGTQSLFSKTAISQVSGGFTTGGTAWYRKHFYVDKKDFSKRFYIQFDGVYMNADVWINGEHLGNHPYGYTGFIFDLTNKIKFGQENVIAVQVKNEGQNSRWYSGSGIYRHVWLKEAEPVHLSLSGDYITTSEVSLSSAKIRIETNVVNETDQSMPITLQIRILDDKGREVIGQKDVNHFAAGSQSNLVDNLVLPDPKLWSTEEPVLYTVVSELLQNGKLVDESRTKFGIRTISFDARNGFRLNGKTTKLKGGCFHNDNGPLGARAYDRAEERKVELMKASGFNAIRCSHNPPSPAFLNACDSLGMLVIDEAFDAWNYGKMPYDYHLYFKDWWRRDITSMILRDRNHPSVIMWSIGNEIPEKGTPLGDSTAFILSRYVQSLDSTRPITSAYNGVDDKADAFFDALGVAGYNYDVDRYAGDHKRKPNRVIVGTESFPLEAFKNWMAVEDDPWVIGDFVWTGFDYIGEASIGWLGYEQESSFYPWNLAYCGDIDICGWKRPQSFYRDVLWKKDQVSIFVKPPKPSFESNPKKEPWSKWNWYDVVADWDWQGYEDSVLEVDVYSSCDEVELYLNGRSFGKKITNRSTKFTAVYYIPYTRGVLKAIGYDKGIQVNHAVLKTAGDAVKLKLSPDKKIINADNEDLSYITVELIDTNNIRNPKAENLIHFSVEGPAIIAGVGNAHPESTESYQLPQRRAWQGRCMLVIKSTYNEGKIIVRASADGIKPAEVTIESRKEL